MATTVTYKGATLTTATNQTKILKTSGKYMEDDVTIVDVSSGGSAVVVTEELDEHGGTIKYINAVDLSNDTVTAAVLLQGYTAHNYLGSAITGTYQGGGGTITLQTKSASYTPTESVQTASITYDAGYNGLDEVDITINAISSSYIGSAVPQMSSADLIASGSTVTVPVGYYATQATKNVASMTLPTTTSNAASTGYTSKATVSRSTADQYINIPSGYNTASAYYKINAVPNGTVTAPATITGTTATVSTGTNTLTLTKTVSVTPNVTTAGYISSGTAGNASISLTANVTTKAAATYTPGTTNQTIASGTYLTGSQTISGDANLVGSNILSTASIFGVQGTVTFQTYYSGSTVPSSSLGADGDIYLKTGD